MFLCDQILEIADYRAQLYDYLKNRMLAIAPNLTTLVGELVGARLIAHAGELLWSLWYYFDMILCVLLVTTVITCTLKNVIIKWRGTLMF